MAKMTLDELTDKILGGWRLTRENLDADTKDLLLHCDVEDLSIAPSPTATTRAATNIPSCPRKRSTKPARPTKKPVSTASPS